MKSKQRSAPRACKSPRNPKRSEVARGKEKKNQTRSGRTWGDRRRKREPGQGNPARIAARAPHGEVEHAAWAPRIRASDRQPGPWARGKEEGAFYSIRAPRIRFEISQDFPRINFSHSYPLLPSSPSFPHLYIYARAAPPSNSNPFSKTSALILSTASHHRKRRFIRLLHLLFVPPSTLRNGCGRPVSVPGFVLPHQGCAAQGRRRQEGRAGDGRRRGGAGADARPGCRRQQRRPGRHRQDPPQLQVQSDHGGFGDEGSRAPLPRPAARREHDHHRLLDARHDRIRAPQAGQGIVPAQGDSGGDHVVGERAQPDQPLPRGGSRGLPPQARPAVGRLPALQPDQMIARRCVTKDAYFFGSLFIFSFSPIFWT